MKKIFLNTLIISFITFSFFACNEKYFDVNTPPNEVTKAELGMRDILSPAIYHTFYAQYSAETTFGNYCQYFGYNETDPVFESQNSTVWNEIYLNALPNLKVIQEKAVELGATHYGAIAKVLTAINILLATDSWGSVPYTEANLGTENTSPAFDTQEQIYSSAISLLDEAITALNATDNSGFSIGSEDIVYGGDIDKWKRAAYTLKARSQLHLVNKGKYSMNDVLASVNSGFTSNSDDFQMIYPSDEINPWYSYDILARNTGNPFHAPGDQIISMMNGTSYPFLSGIVTIDPRLPIIYENEGATGEPWRGSLVGGDGASSDTAVDGNTYYKDGGFHTTATSPLIIITYAEAMFIKAEATFIANGGTETSSGTTADAYNAYMAGITANMDKLGADGTNYSADLAVNVGATNLMLNHIMKEKYIANILNPETYNDFRRYNFSSNVFKDLALRVGTFLGDDKFPGEWYRRTVYPTTEKNANEAVVNANWQEANVDVWWAQ